MRHEAYYMHIRTCTSITSAFLLQNIFKSKIHLLVRLTTALLLFTLLLTYLYSILYVRNSQSRIGQWL